MNCLECSVPTKEVPNTAIGDCAYCGAGVCLDHARVIRLHSQPLADAMGGTLESIYWMSGTYDGSTSSTSPTRSPLPR